MSLLEPMKFLDKIEDFRDKMGTISIHPAVISGKQSKPEL
jgi:hypothetical protein